MGGQISYSRETKDSRPPSLCHQSTATAVFLGLIYTCGHPVTVTAMGQVGRSGRFGLESSKISRLYSQSENLSLRLVFLFVHMTATSLHRNVKCFRFLQHPSSTMTMTWSNMILGWYSDENHSRYWSKLLPQCTNFPEWAKTANLDIFQVIWKLSKSSEIQEGYPQGSLPLNCHKAINTFRTPLREAPLKLAPPLFGHCPNSDCDLPNHRFDGT